MNQHLDAARRVLDIEIRALEQLSEELSEAFSNVVELLKFLHGRIILSGVGKSGHVARKVSATLASTGSTSLYVHPTEASHGDMGMITPGDAVIALSRSGETKELADLIGYCRRFSIPLVAMTTCADSALGRAATHILALPDAPEACAETRAPTTSTTLQMALGDALAVALLEAKGFTASDFKTFHPGGTLGSALSIISDLMHVGDALPLTAPGTFTSEVLAIMSHKGFGCVGIVENEILVGMITDGDIRRNLSDSLGTRLAKDIMVTNPKIARADELAANVLRRMTGKRKKIMQMFVVENGRPIGLIHLHDFLRVGLM
ncbi:MAG: KpsF/GutQ family sugar-phosphate isomerase [Hyphomonadaceae bacterium]|nr:KpsF/GutQ family sugar-phosphate isomerase [Hyphomonadaceae bacterium]